jgi:hypothetical protein
MRSNLCSQHILNLDESEACLVVPDSLSVDSCEKRTAWLTALLRKTRGQAMLRQGLTKLHTSVVATDDDQGTK